MPELAASPALRRSRDGLEEGLLRLDGRRVRAAHPLLAAAARKRSRPRERRELHRALARAVDGPQLRALHLALATESATHAAGRRGGGGGRGRRPRAARHRAVQLASARSAYALGCAGAPRAPARARRPPRDGRRAAALTDLLEPAIDAAGRRPAGARLAAAGGGRPDRARSRRPRPPSRPRARRIRRLRGRARLCAGEEGRTGRGRAAVEAASVTPRRRRAGARLEGDGERLALVRAQPGRAR